MKWAGWQVRDAGFAHVGVVGVSCRIQKYYCGMHLGHIYNLVPTQTTGN